MLKKLLAVPTYIAFAMLAAVAYLVVVVRSHLPFCGRQSVSLGYCGQGNAVTLTSRSRTAILDLNTLCTTPLPHPVQDCEYAAFSPDGNQIAFVRLKPDQWENSLCICQRDGSDVKELTPGSTYYYLHPVFSRDGKKIVFSRANRLRDYSMGGKTWDDYDIFVINTDGTGLRQLTRQRYRYASAAGFADKGGEVVFGAIDGNPLENVLFSVSEDGSTAPRPINGLYHASNASFSPDGKHLTFISDKAVPYNYEIWAADADGQNARQLTHERSYAQNPIFTPDGKGIVFLSSPARNFRFDLCRVEIATGVTTRLAASRFFDKPFGRKP